MLRNSTTRQFRIPLKTVCGLILFFAAGIVWTTRFWTAQAAPAPVNANELEFQKFVKPFFDQNCMLCHSTDVATAGIRVDQLDASFEDRQIRPWEAIRQKVGDGTMPPPGMPQPTAAERKQMVEWITQNMEAARVRVAPKNGLVRRLTEIGRAHV